MNRTLAPEWLDVLPPQDLAAIGSRRDLRRLNYFMRHPALVAGALRACFPGSPPRCLAELGAGDGAFLLQSARLLAPHWPRLHVVLVDRQPSFSESAQRAFARIGWTTEVVAADVFDWLEMGGVEAAVANLFLHHFDDPQLGRLLRAVAARRIALVACEPRRAWFPYVASHLLGGLGCNAVTRHDAPISVRAGFRGAELTALWPRENWLVREREAGLFSHLFQARPAP
ncbi:MAG TPA: class I SAM-dependent methyltransferase [Verrucomicrobiae bacterium]|jgi:hypothetical protein|nr:class I SAM-dependent methyltransferase [Verrucomicrobiae bacterium]